VGDWNLPKPTFKDSSAAPSVSEVARKSRDSFGVEKLNCPSWDFLVEVPMNGIACSVCSGAGHKAKHCPELRSPLREGFQGGGGGGGHSHGDDDDEEKALKVCVARAAAITVPPRAPAPRALQRDSQGAPLP
jgi:hypothetical protein